LVNGEPTVSLLRSALAQTIGRARIDVVCLDPFIKSHSLEENGNNAIDFVAGVLVQLAIEHNCAVDAPHHVNKGLSDPGNANRARGASSFKDAARLVYTLTPMSEDEAKLFGLDDAERQSLIRFDPGKVNIAPHATAAKWFRLVSVKIGNGTELYPHGDDVQTVERWEPPDMWKGLPTATLNKILDEIDQGLPAGRLYSHRGAAVERAAWRVVVKHLDNTEAQAREIIKTWVKNGVLKIVDYHDEESRKAREGLRVEPAKRPG
jgi:hypothetical protein